MKRSSVKSGSRKGRVESTKKKEKRKTLDSGVGFARPLKKIARRGGGEPEKRQRIRLRQKLK